MMSDFTRETGIRVDLVPAPEATCGRPVEAELGTVRRKGWTLSNSI